MDSERRAHERLLHAIGQGRIIRDPATYEYQDVLGKLRRADELVYTLEERGWLILKTDGTVEATKAARQWLARPRNGAKPQQVAFSSPGRQP